MERYADVHCESTNMHTRCTHASVGELCLCVLRFRNTHARSTQSTVFLDMRPMEPFLIFKFLPLEQRAYPTDTRELLTCVYVSVFVFVHVYALVCVRMSV
jgi:hypothetical protein